MQRRIAACGVPQAIGLVHDKVCADDGVALDIPPIPSRSPQHCAQQTAPGRP